MNPLVSRLVTTDNCPMPSTSAPRRVASATGTGLGWVQRLGPESFARWVQERDDIDRWRLIKVSQVGVSFFLTTDPHRRARVTFYSNGVAPIVSFGTNEASLVEVLSEPPNAWRVHFAMSRGYHVADAELVEALHKVLRKPASRPHLTIAVGAHR